MRCALRFVLYGVSIFVVFCRVVNGHVVRFQFFDENWYRRVMRFPPSRADCHQGAGRGRRGGGAGVDPPQLRYSHCGHAFNINDLAIRFARTLRTLVEYARLFGGRLDRHDLGPIAGNARQLVDGARQLFPCHFMGFLAAASVSSP